MQAIFDKVVYDTEKATKVFSHDNGKSGVAFKKQTLYRGNANGLYFLAATRYIGTDETAEATTEIIPDGVFFDADRISGYSWGHDWGIDEECFTRNDDEDTEKDSAFDALEWAERVDMPGDLFLKFFKERGAKEA